MSVPTWSANPGPQSRFLATTVYECLYGGAAGGGKSEALIMGALRFIHEPSYRALIIRRTYGELQQLWDRAAPWYQANGGIPNKSEHRWTFPSGAQIEFGYCENDNDVTRYQGREYSYLGVDEATLITERSYLYLLSRLRSVAGLPIYVRLTANPAGPDNWVFKRFQPWLDSRPSYAGIKGTPAKPLYYRLSDQGEQWCERQPGALSRMFIPAKATDNPALMQNDPGYVERLAALDPVTRAQLRDGDWLAQPGRGLLFKRTWFEVVAQPPTGIKVRYWDRAATEAKPGTDPDFTVGLKLCRTPQGIYYVEDVVRFRGTPAEVEATIKHTAEADGKETMIGIEQDPGQAGKFEAAYYVKALAGYNVRTFPVTKKKVVRAQPASAQAEAGNIKLVVGEWLPYFLSELEAFPEGTHDDQVDALSGAFSALTETPVRYLSEASADWESPKRTF